MIRKIKKKLFYIFYDIKRRVRILLKLDQNIFIGLNNNYSICIPPEHLLSLYKKVHFNYDQFLPKNLSFFKDLKSKNDKKFETNDNNLSVIDIGANVGDTLYHLVSSNNKHKYFCIEAEKYFYSYLKKNVENLKRIEKNLNVTLINKLVGDNISGYMKIANGTATIADIWQTEKRAGWENITEKNEILYSETLDKIVDEYNIDNILLIKVDTDGYDHQVLLSGIKTIEKYKPILFFEYLDHYNKNFESYKNFFYKLQKIGYSKYKALNKRGDIIIENCSLEDLLSQLKKYQILDLLFYN